MTETAVTRPALDESTTHVLHFGNYCGATLLDRVRGNGLWVLMTADDYAKGYEHHVQDPDGWEADSPQRTPTAILTAWVTALAGYPVKLTRADELVDPGWGSLMAYRVTRRDG
jgi:hypothetical protein